MALATQLALVELRETSRGILGDSGMPLFVWGDDRLAAVAWAGYHAGMSEWVQEAISLPGGGSR